jgi:enamine deaminase RidA (YjgF/YER057c/UK114 family)
VETALQNAGSSLADVVRTRVYLVRVEDFEAVGRAHGEAFSEIRPANTTVVVSGLVDPRWLLEIEAEAVVTSGTSPA